MVFGDCLFCRLAESNGVGVYYGRVVWSGGDGFVY